jgi:hypothetical protein
MTSPGVDGQCYEAAHFAADFISHTLLSMAC